MGVTRSWNLDILDPRLRQITRDAANRPDHLDKIVKIESYNLATDKQPHKVSDSEYSGLGPFTETWEKKGFDEDDPVRGFKKTTSYKKYALKVTFSEEVKDDDLFGVCDVIAGQIGESYKLTRNLQAAQLWDNAFNTTFYTTADGKALCATDHLSRGGGGNRSNTLATSESLSYSGVQKLLQVAYRQKDHRGYPDPQFKPGDTVRILHQPEDLWVATELFSHLSNYRPTDNSNAPNVLLLNQKFELVCNEYQTATGASSTRLWFMLSANPSAWIPVLKDRHELRTSSYLVDGDKSLVYDGRARYAFHTPFWYGFLGSGN